VDRQDGIERVRKVNALRLGNESRQRAIAIEASGPSFFDDFEIGLAVAVQQLITDLPDLSRRSA
jgi:hypothetical protein